MYEIQTEDFYKDISVDVKHRFDTSDYSPDHPSGIPSGFNKKVLGMFSLNIFILHRLRNKFLQLILDSSSWELHQYSRRMCGPMKNPKVETPGTRTWDLMIARPTLYLTTTDTTLVCLKTKLEVKL